MGRCETREAEELEGRHPTGQFVAGHFGLRQFTAAAPALEDGARGLGRGLGGFPAMAERRGFRRQHLLCLIDVAALQLLDPSKIQFGEEAQKASDVVVFGIAPKLPIFIGRQPLGIEPDGTLSRLAHLDAGRGRDQRRRQAEQGAHLRPPGEFDAGDDVAPLVGTADLQLALMPPGQLSKIVGLQNRVVEFEEAQGLVALEPKPHAVQGQHPVDREMAPDIAKQRDVAQFVEPICIVDHDGFVRPIAELQELREDSADPRHIAGDFFVIEEFPRLVFARRVADPRRAAPHQHDRLVPAPLEEAQQHDRHQAADMQTVRRAVIADIGYKPAGEQPLVERFHVGALVDKAAFERCGEEGGTRCRHGFVI